MIATSWTASFYDLRSVAEQAADDYHSNHDGWEASWPQIICVEQDGETGTFSVDRDNVPVCNAVLLTHFMATEVRSQSDERR